jgi:hypothetical protein
VAAFSTKKRDKFALAQKKKNKETFGKFKNKSE